MSAWPSAPARRVDDRCPTEKARQVRIRIQEFQNRIQSLVKTGVADLDDALQRTIAERTKYLAQSDVAGHYLFQGVTPGNYLLSGWYASAVDNTGWLVEVQVPEKRTQNLSNFNLSDPRFEHNWREGIRVLGLARDQVGLLD